MNLDSLDAPTPDTEEKIDPKIIAVEFLDGDNETETAVDRKQWVNLPCDDQWVEQRYITNKDRLGLKPRVKVRFDQKGSHKFKLKIDPGGSNLAYLAEEKTGNPDFVYTAGEKQYTTDADGTKIIEDDWLLDCCGGNVWRLQAEDDYGNKVESHNLTGMRLMYLVEARMENVPAAQNLDRCQQEFEKHGIVIERLPAVTMPLIPNIVPESAQTTTLEDNTRVAYLNSQGPQKEPFAIVAAFTDHLADKYEDRDLTANVEIVAGGGAQSIDLAVLNSQNKEAVLWHNIQPGDDWFVSCFYTPDPPDHNYGAYSAAGATSGAVTGAGIGTAVGGLVGTLVGGVIGGLSGAVAGVFLHPENVQPPPIMIAKHRCTLIPRDNYPDAYSTVRIDLSDLPVGSGKIMLTVNLVQTMVAGLAFVEANLVCIATRTYCKPVDDGDQNMILIHELGHKLAMVCEGRPGQPKRVATQYLEKGHRGSHCHTGLDVLDWYKGVSGSTCVMFGETNGYASFCNECTPALKKMGFGQGWPRL